MSNPETHLQSYEHEISCPHCGASLTLISPMEHILMASRTCPVCKREFLIEDDKAVKVPDAARKKPSKNASRN